MSVAAAVRKEIQAIDPDQPVASVKPMTAWVDESVASQRYRTTLLALFAVLAMVLAATGIYGVMSYTVAQRTQEIGIRVALGATPATVLKMVVGDGMRLAAAGLAIGLVGAFAVTRLASAMLYGVSTTDVVTYAAIAVVLALVALVATVIPARRATRVDPMLALRAD
jgi:putative ABC transport system permease protein